MASVIRARSPGTWKEAENSHDDIFGISPHAHDRPARRRVCRTRSARSRASGQVARRDRRAGQRVPLSAQRPAPGAAPDQTVQFAVLGYAITSMETETYRPARLILLGEDASPQLRRSTSLDSLVTSQSPPFFVWHTAEDPYVPPEHTYRFASALAASHVPHAVHVFAHGPHSLGLAQGAGEAAVWTTLADAWIHEQESAPG